jgi:outer membrane protein OmpA-like peptidoglycan-associated protein
MRKLTGTIVSVLAAAALAGCGTSLQEAESLTPAGSEFDVSLHGGYTQLSRSEYGEGDYNDSDFFAGRAIGAGTGAGVSPQEIAARDLPEDHVGELSSARARLTDALGKGAAEKVPGDAAHAQVMFDCWMQEQEENFQPDDISRCRAEFDTAMAAVEAGIAPPIETAAPAPEPMFEPKSWIVYFAFDESGLTPEAQAIIAEAAAYATGTDGASVSIDGHTDTAGGASYNADLSQTRADAVALAVSANGVAAGRIASAGHGEAELAVATGDGTAEAANRRAVISVTK